MLKRWFMSLGLLLLPLAACGPGLDSASLGWFADGNRRPQSGTALRLEWIERLTPTHEGPYIPVERASAALDPSRDRVYVGSTAGSLYALKANGREVYRVQLGGAIEAAPAFDDHHNELIVATEQGTVHAIRAIDGSMRWEVDLGVAIRQAPVRHGDAAYVVTERDQVVALALDDGASLWRVERAAPSGFTIAGRAGLTLHEGRLITAFSDGTIMSIDPSDGDADWVVETAVDVPRREGEGNRILDVDTTPVVIGDTIYVGSFSAGLYALDAQSGTLRWRDAELTGAVGLAHADGRLLVASADRGLVCLDPVTREVFWTRAQERGAPSPPTITDGLVLVGESEGSFLALDIRQGREVARIDSGQGFSAAAAATGGRGFVLSNGGTLYAFRLGA